METMKTKIERDGRQWSYTVTTPDGQVAVREGGFFKRESAAVQAKVAMRDLESYQPEAFDIAYCPKCGKGFETDFSVPDDVYCSACDYVVRTSD